MTLYNTLDIERNATQKEVKAAYRKKSKEHHPDKSFSHHYKGGNGEAFIPIAKAYLILSDPIKRKRYDETGIEADISSSEKAANGVLQKLFSELIQKVGVEKILSFDVVGAMDRSLAAGLEKLHEEKKGCLSKKKAFEKILKRIKHKDRHNNLSLVIIGQIEEEQKQLCNILQNMETAKIAIKMLTDYGFKFDATKPSSFLMRHVSFTASTATY
jgi:curved DNA-binding protein CbpA